MRRTLLLLALPLLSSCSRSPARVELLPESELPAIATGSEGEERDAAISRLRSLGPAGLRLLMDSVPVRAVIAVPARGERRERDRTELVLDAVDRVAAQRDAIASGLYWHVDLGEAKAEAARTGKPILSLRLLGRLDEELSCANSRFFRTVLYANARISSELRDGWVLHWESVRPVPKLTVDFGDGRTIVTTITGNSIHYVLAADGRALDALPGLWGSDAFLAELLRAKDLAATLRALPPREADAALRAWHAERLTEIGREIRSDADRLPEPERTKLLAILLRKDQDGSAVPDDIVFSTGSFVSFPEGTKMTVEEPYMLELVQNVHGMRGEIADETWSALARLHEDECRLDESSRALARRKEGGAAAEPLFESLRRSVAEDTVRNRYMTGARLHEWFASGRAPADVRELNERVYRELFMSPLNDAWLGLVPPDRYQGLDGGGRHGSRS